MLPIPDNHVTRPLSSQDTTSAQVQNPPPTSSRTQQLFPSPTPVTTGQLAHPSPYNTAKLSMNGTTTTNRMPTFIPGTKKRTSSTTTQHSPRQRRPFLFIVGLVGSLAMILLVTLFVAPLDNGQNGHPAQTLAQIIGHDISTNSFGVLNLAQQVPTPTATPALLTNEGYCGGTDIWGKCATAATDNGVMGTGQMQHPIAGATITQVFAHPEYQSWCGCWKPHTGIDLAAPYGTPVMAADNGQVIWTGWDWSGLGWAVKINHGHYIATIYGHMARFIVKVGETVTKGQVIGYEGSTGASTGPHLHFMVLVNNMWVDPTIYIALP